MSVTIGSLEWIDGVRPGMSVVDVWPEGAGFDVAVDDHLVGVPAHQPPGSATPVAIALVLLVAAAFLAFSGIPGRSLALTLAAVVAMQSMLGYITLPAAAFVVPIPVVVAVLITGPRTGRGWRVLAGGASAGGLVLGGALFATEWTGPHWPAIWLAEAGLAVGFVLVVGTSDLVTGYRRWAERPTRSRTFSHLIIELVPAARRGRLSALEEERANTVSRVHDQLLPRLAQSMRALEQEVDRPGAAVANLHALEDDLRVMIDDRQTHVLRDGGLWWALEALAEQVRAEGLESHLLADRDGERAPRHVELAAYRIAQVAIDNARAHARASRIDVDLTCGSTWVRLRVTDDGVGIAADASRQALSRGRIGLAEIYHWADEVGGTIEISGAWGAGTEVVFRWSR